MAVNLLMTWVPSARRWTKKHNGKWYAISCRKLGVPETKEASWRAANDWWENQQQTIDKAPPSEEDLRANAVRVWSMVQDWSVLDERKPRAARRLTGRCWPVQEDQVPGRRHSRVDPTDAAESHRQSPDRKS